MPNHLGGLFSQTADGSTISGTITESSIMGSGVGSLSVPANVFSVGDAFHCKIGGEMSADANETIRMKIKSGSVILVDTGVLTLPAITNRAWEAELDFCIRAIGGAGVASISSNGQLVFQKDGVNSYEGRSYNDLENTNFDTTVSNTLDVTVEWGSTNANNSIVASYCVLLKTF